MLAKFSADLACTDVPHIKNDSNNNTRMLPSLSQSTQTQNVLKAFLWFDDFSQLSRSRSTTSHFQRATYNPRSV